MDVVDFVAATVKKIRAYDIRHPLKKYELTNTITIISIIIIIETFPCRLFPGRVSYTFCLAAPLCLESVGEGTVSV